MGESIYQMTPEGEENKTENIADTESVYSMQTSITRFSAVTYATDQLGITVRLNEYSRVIPNFCY